MSQNIPPHDPLQELLAGAALGDLSPDELRELQTSATPLSQSVREAYELTAAALDLALTSGEQDELPSELRQKILAAAPGHLPANPVVTQAAPFTEVSGKFTGLLGGRELLAWVAVAASLLLAAFAYWQPIDRPGPSIVEKTLVAQRAELLDESATPLIQATWAAGKHPLEQPVTGDVVWSNERQEGYMRFVGLPVNNPQRQQYQLWIIDPTRDDVPIDGGVFDITTEGEVIVPIRAKLKVSDPQAFAITVEQPGGVVVSEQTNLPLLAPVASQGA